MNEWTKSFFTFFMIHKSSGVYLITLLRPLFKNVSNKLASLYLGSLSSLVSCFWVRPELTWVKPLSGDPLLCRLLALNTNIMLKRPVSVKHSSLLWAFVIYGRKSFYDWPRCLRYHILSLMLLTSKLECFTWQNF